MQTFILKPLFESLSKLPMDEKKLFSDKVNSLGRMNKTELRDSEDVVPLKGPDKGEFYAYGLEGSSYILFTFKDKNLIVVDIIDLTDEGKLRSFAFADNNEESDDCSNNA